MDRKDVTNLVIGEDLIQASNIHAKQTKQSVSAFVRNALALWTQGIIGIETNEVKVPTKIDYEYATGLNGVIFTLWVQTKIGK